MAQLIPNPITITLKARLLARAFRNAERRRSRLFALKYAKFRLKTPPTTGGQTLCNQLFLSQQKQYVSPPVDGLFFAYRAYQIHVFSDGYGIVFYKILE